MRVEFAPAASRELESIGDYIARENPRRAVAFVEELEASAVEIGANPKAYALVPRYEAHGIRRRLHGSYLIFFRIEPDRVTILHILHGARDYGALMFPDEE